MYNNCYSLARVWAACALCRHFEKASPTVLCDPNTHTACTRTKSEVIRYARSTSEEHLI